MKYLIILITTLLLLCCVSPSTRRGSLSDAFEASDQPNERDREVDDGYSLEPIYNDDEDYYYPEKNEEEQVEDVTPKEYSPPDFRFTGIETRYSNIFLNDFNNGLGLNGYYGTNTDGFGLSFKAGVNWFAINENNKVYEQLNGGILSLNFGVEVRKNITGMNKPILLDLVVDSNIALLPWVYNNEITSVVIDEYGNTREDKIKFDSISTFSLGIGPGICLWDSKTVALFVDPSIGFNLFYPYTTQGFTNDVFDPYIYFKVMVKMLMVSRPKKD